MQKIISRALFCVSIAVVLAGCKSEGDTPKVEGSIDIPSTENIKPVFEAGGDTKTVTFTATAAWNAVIQDAAENDWMTISPESGQAGKQVLTMIASKNRTSAQRVAVISLNCGKISRKIVATQEAGGYEPEPEAEGFPAVWDFYSLGYTNATKAEALKSPAAANWTTGNPNPTLKTTYGNQAAYMKVYAKEGLYVKSDMTVTLNPGIQACGLLEGDYYEFVIPVEKFGPTVEISVYGATGASSSSVGFWTLEYSSDGNTWYEAPGALDAKVKSVSTKAHFWSTESTTSTARTVYYASADDSFHFHRFCCEKLSYMEKGDLHLRLKAQKYSSAFDGSNAPKGWSDIKGFHVYLASEKPNPLMKIVAHRGGYVENGLVQCSRASLKKTLSQNCIGSECDIMWTGKDDDVIVCHPDGDNKVLGLVPGMSSVAEIKAAGSIGGGENVPTFKEFLDIITDKTYNPYGAQLWVDVKWVNQTVSDKALYKALDQAREKHALDYVIFMIKDSNYASLATEIKKNYGVDVAWNGTITEPSKYGPNGWAQVQYGSYSSSQYWPPTTYTDAGVVCSIYNCASALSGYQEMYETTLKYYPKLRALFVNHPMDLTLHLVAGGYEK